MRRFIITTALQGHPSTKFNIWKMESEGYPTSSQLLKEKNLRHAAGEKVWGDLVSIVEVGKADYEAFDH